MKRALSSGHPKKDAKRGSFSPEKARVSEESSEKDVRLRQMLLELYEACQREYAAHVRLQGELDNVPNPPSYIVTPWHVCVGEALTDYELFKTYVRLRCDLIQAFAPCTSISELLEQRRELFHPNFAHLKKVLADSSQEIVTRWDALKIADLLRSKEQEQEQEQEQLKLASTELDTIISKASISRLRP